MIRERFTFYGSVQRVGFRRRARRAASRFGCTGWARNESDGSVTMELQGERGQIDAVIEATGSGRLISIERTESVAVPLVPDERGFSRK